ncbi:MAG: RNA methyltransferase [Bacteroidetes bacterium]|nr:RNA methyltransferase [Bacteroidota bacterium]
MLTKAQNKYIRALSQQKNRNEHGTYVVEGEKLAEEWLASDCKIQMVVALTDWVKMNTDLLAKHPEAEVIHAEPHHLESITGLQTANQVILVAYSNKTPKPIAAGAWCIALDTLQDPGNMGTIIRIADWFGINHVIASPGSVDFYNPKVIQSAMGGHLRVNLHKEELDAVFSKLKSPVYAATLGGENIYKLKEKTPGFILIGNESKGISEELLNIATQQITIPRKGGAESLNAAVSAGIICALLIEG